MTGGLLFGGGWLLAGLGSHSFVFTILGIGALAGVGAGMAYIVPIAVGIRWFPKAKGLVTGIAVAGFWCLYGPGLANRTCHSRFSKGSQMSRATLLNSPLLLGFEQIEQVLDRVAKGSGDGYPPYNIEQLTPESGKADTLRITLAVAGFTKDPNRALLTAVQMKAEAAEYYRKLAPAAENRYIRTFLQILANREEEQRDILANMLDAQRRTGFDRTKSGKIIPTTPRWLGMYLLDDPDE